MPTRYRSPDEDSARWDDFAFRDGDIVISARSKSGTTWVQMIVALLVFQEPTLPAPLAELSPWLDWLGEDRDVLLSRLAAQDHRRFIKTHTPLDGIPLNPKATYVVVGRHPLDMAVSLYFQGDNLNRERMRLLTGAPESATVPVPRAPLHDWLLAWIDRDVLPHNTLDSLPGVMWHLSDAWARRNDPNVLLVHYDQLMADRELVIRKIAARLGITVAEARWPALVEAASFQQMRAHAYELAPDMAGVIKSRTAFFRRGTSGAGEEVLSIEELARYDARAAGLAAPEVLEWLHRGG